MEKLVQRKLVFLSPFFAKLVQDFPRFFLLLKFSFKNKFWRRACARFSFFQGRLNFEAANDEFSAMTWHKILTLGCLKVFVNI
jgi:hypothetical protein